MVRHSPHTPSAHRSERRGFALLITITLLAFLVLLLVSLASLTRVETQVASNNQQLSQARQNALMALNIALGQLQKYAGPDQRVTTTADLLADKDKAGVNAPAPLHATTIQVDVKPGSRYWTAVWGNTEQSISYTLRPNQVPPTAAGGNRRGVTPGVLNWLISGNESASFTPKGTAGGVNTGTNITYRPGDAIDLSDLAKPKVKGDDAVILIGEKAVGTGATAQKDYVVAPLVNITAPAGSVPGLSSAASVGRYAWWVGDEGVKARINLQNGYQTLPAADQPAAQINSFLTAQRSAIEFMDRDPVGTTSPERLSDYVFTATSLLSVNTPQQFPLLGTSATAQANLSTASKNRFHDITATSFGVLSDTYAGGLKKDLTADIADTSTPAAPSTRPADDAPLFTPINSAEINLPNWGHLRSWARTRPDSASGQVDPTSTQPRAAGIFPYLAHFSLGLDWYFDLSPTPPPAPVITPTPLASAALKLGFCPFVVLHNPYSTTMAPATYEVALRMKGPSKLVVEMDDAGNKVYATVAHIHLSSLAATLPTDPVPSEAYFRFRLSAKAMPPGHRHVYVLEDAADGSLYDHANPRTLRRIDETSGGLLNMIVINGPTITHSNLKDLSRVRLRGNTSSSVSQAAASLKYIETTFVLAEQNAFASTTWPIVPPIGQWYQSVNNVIPMFRRLAPGGTIDSPTIAASTFFTPVGRMAAPDGSMVNDTANTDSSGASIGELLRDKGFNITTTGAIRLSAQHDSNGGFWSSHYHTGLNHNTAIRYIATGSLRAPFLQATALENSNTLPGGGNRGIDNKIGAVIVGAVIAGNTPDDSTSNPHPSISYTGYSTGFGENPSAYRDNPVVLWDVLESPDRLLSLGQFQHASLSRYGFQTSYAVGNSQADMRIYRNLSYRSNSLTPINGGTQPLYDISWHLNRNLWDRYFISGIPSTLASLTDPLPNARMTIRNDFVNTPSLDAIRYAGSGTNEAYDKASSHLLVSGAFNINSTSEQAWRAVLGGTYGLPQNDAYATSDDGIDTAIPYPRFSRNMASGAIDNYTAYTVTSRPDPVITNPSATDSTARVHKTLFYGNRGLYLQTPNMPANNSPATVVNELARSIVNEIRRRGPFLSLSDFINRPLTLGTEPAGIKGALQAGIDNMNPNVAQVNPWFYPSKVGSLRNLAGAYAGQYEWNVGELNQHAVGGVNLGSGISNGNDPATYKNEVYRAPYAMAPKYLTQADLLSTLGPALSARSDTFTIRAYGEGLDVINSTATTPVVTSRAWCEAVVQRIPDYVAGEDAHLAPGALPASSASLTFGRKFRVVSFRWLSANDI